MNCFIVTREHSVSSKHEASLSSFSQEASLASFSTRLSQISSLGTLLDFLCAGAESSLFFLVRFG